MSAIIFDQLLSLSFVFAQMSSVSFIGASVNPFILLFAYFSLLYI